MRWRFILYSIVAMSTMKPEYMAITEAMKETIWLQGLVDELGIDQNLLKINYDSMRAIYLAKNQVYHARTKHIDIKFHFVREILEVVTSSYKNHTKESLICLPMLFRE